MNNKNSFPLTIRFADFDDVAGLREIYKPYVLETAISFEYELPSLDEFLERMRVIQQKYPYLVAEQDNVIVGYAYARPLIGRSAYDWSSETTIYVERTRKRQGIGRSLYNTLESILKKMNIVNLYACIGYSTEDDEYLTKESALFHARLGFSAIGEFHQCGYKFNRWYHMVWMEKIIANHIGNPPAILNVNDIKNALSAGQPNG